MFLLIVCRKGIQIFGAVLSQLCWFYSFPPGAFTSFQLSEDGVLLSLVQALTEEKITASESGRKVGVMSPAVDKRRK